MISNMSYCVTLVSTFNNNASAKISFSVLLIFPFNSVHIHMALHLEFMVVKEAVGKVFLPVHRFFSVTITTQILYTHILLIMLDAN
jgi:hypothetical protein